VADFGLTRRLYNTHTKDPASKKLPLDIWEAIVSVFGKIEAMNMELKVMPGTNLVGSYSYYETESDEANEFISSLAELDDLLMTYELES